VNEVVVVSTRRKSSATSADQAILGDERAAELRADLDAMRAQLADVARQVHAQFTTISAHAEIARQQAEFAREEARADLERTRSLMIELMERTRRELSIGQLHTPGTVQAAPNAVAGERIDVLESQMADVLASINRCFDRQRVLAETVESLFDAVLAEGRNEPVAGLSLV
jgi:uncharacterized protein YhaN